jgi:hypothetical protein
MISFKQTCIDCHFLHRETRAFNDGGNKMEITQAQRNQSKHNDFSWQSSSYTLGCYKGIWDEGHNFPNQDKYKIIVKKNRKNKCYFWKFQPGTFLNAAENLYDKNLEFKASTGKYRLTIYGLIISIISLLILTIKYGDRF